MEKNLRSYCFSFIKHTGIALLLPLAAMAKDMPGTGNSIAITNSEIAFIRNVGQVIDQNRKPVKNIDYKFSNGAATVYIGKGQLRYVWYKSVPANAEQKEQLKLSARVQKNTDLSGLEMYCMGVDLVGCNQQAEVIAGEEQPYFENYYLPYCNGKTAHSYRKITYRNIYPNIDWVLYTDGKDTKGFKYDFIIHPGGRTSDIKMQYNGATTLGLRNGELTASTPMGSITEHKPYSYDAVTKQEINSSYVLSDNMLSFDVAASDHEIVIDPILNWGTYFGNPHYVYGTCTAADTFGNSFICGYTKESSIMPLIGPHQPTYGGGNNDGFIAQFDITGTICKWRTYYGGDNFDQILAAVCDKAGNLYVTGITTSTTNIGTVGAQQNTNGGDLFSGHSLNDAFIGKFSGTGTLLWGTYVGGLYIEEGYAIACDHSNNVYVGGVTTGSDGIYTTGAFQSTAGPGFFAKYNGTTGIRIWGSYINGNVNAIATDNKGNVFVGGNTTSVTGITTPLTHKPTFGTGILNGFIAKFRTANCTRAWGTYYGGEKDNDVLALTCDSLYNVYAAGTTSSTTEIASTGAQFGSIQFTYSNGWLAKIDSTGQRKWGTYYAGGIRAVVLGPDNKLYIGGTTFNTGDIATPGAHQSVYAGPPFAPPPAPTGYDGFIGKFNLDGKRLWGTYYGGPDNERFITVNYGAGKVYVGGTSHSKSGIATGTGWQNTMVDTELAFIAQFQGDTSVYFKFPYIDTLLCAGGPLTVNYRVTNKFNSSNVFMVQLSNAAGSFTSPTTIGSLTSTDNGIINCTIPSTVPQGTGYKLRILASSPKDTFYNYDMPVRVSKYYKPDALALQPVCENSPLQIIDVNGPPPAGTSFLWTGPGGYIGYFATVNIGSASMSHTGDFYVETDNYTCKAKDTVSVVVSQSPPPPTITGDTSLCIGDTLVLTANSTVPGVTWQWLSPKFQAPTTQKFTLLNADPSDVGVYKVAALKNGCASAYGEKGVTVHSLPYPSVFNNTPVCVGDSIKFNANDTIPGVTFLWKGPNGFTSTSIDNVIPKAQLTDAGIYMVTTRSIHGCEGTNGMSIVVKPLPNQVEATNNGPTCSGLDLQLTANNATPGASYAWTGPNGYTGQGETVTIQNIAANRTGIYKVEVDLNGCKKEDTMYATIYQTPDTPIFTCNNPVFVGGILKFVMQNPQPNAAYTWRGPQFYSMSQDAIVSGVTFADAGVYTVSVRTGICEASDTITIKVLEDTSKGLPRPSAVFPNPNNGSFKIFGGTKTNRQVQIIIYATDGKEVHREFIEPQNYRIDHTVNVTGVANGTYRLKLVIDGKATFLSFVIKV